MSFHLFLLTINNDVRECFVQFHRRLTAAATSSTMQADDWWSHRGETSAEVVRDDRVDDEDGSGRGSSSSSGGRRRDRHGRWRLPISDDYDYENYYRYYAAVYYYDDYDASGSGVEDDGESVDCLLESIR